MTRSQRDRLPPWSEGLVAAEPSRSLRLSPEWAAILLALVTTIGGGMWKLGSLSSKVDEMDKKLDRVIAQREGFVQPSQLPLTSTGPMNPVQLSVINPGAHR